MIKATCPHCNSETTHRIVKLRSSRNLLWCQRCFRIRFEKWGFSLPLEPMRLDAALNVHVEVLDADHIHLMDLLNYMGTLEDDKATLAAEGKNLLRLTAEHFSREDALLKQHEYPDIHQHDIQRTSILNEMRKNIDIIAYANGKAFHSALFKLKCCLIDLLEDDMKYKRYLSK